MISKVHLGMDSLQDKNTSSNISDVRNENENKNVNFPKYGKSYLEFYQVNSQISIDSLQFLRSKLDHQHDHVINVHYIEEVQKEMIVEWRRKASEWIYSVTDYFCLSRETGAIAMSYLDQYLSLTTVNKHSFQLVAMSSLFIASKLFEKRSIRMKNVISLSGFTKNEIIKMEWEILNKIGWKVNPLTPFSFLRLLLRFLFVSTDSINNIIDTSKYYIELSVCDYSFLKFSPSVIAVSSILNSFEDASIKVKLDEQSAWMSRLETVGIVHNHQLESCRGELKSIYVKTCQWFQDQRKNVARERIDNNDTSEKNAQQTPSPTGVEDIDSFVSKNNASEESVKEEFISVSHASAISDMECGTLYKERENKRLRSTQTK